MAASFQNVTPSTAPNYVLYRSGIVGADAGPYNVMMHGLNTSSFQNLFVQLVCGASAAPAAKAYFWSAAAGMFLPSTYLQAALAAGVSSEFTVPCGGRITFIELTGTLTSGVDIYVAGNPY